jgi:hypothetical protein
MPVGQTRCRRDANRLFAVKRDNERIKSTVASLALGMDDE